MVLVWFLFELILDYFGSKDLNLYQNTILAILITDRHSVHFINLIWISLLQSTLVNCGPIWCTSVHLSSIRSIRSTSVNLVQFNQFQSIRSTSVQFGTFFQFNPLKSIQSSLVYSVYLVHFKSLRKNLMYLLKNWKIQVWVESNINCNYMIFFYYHNNLLKRMRIWIITLKLKNFNCTKRN